MSRCTHTAYLCVCSLIGLTITDTTRILVTVVLRWLGDHGDISTRHDGLQIVVCHIGHDRVDHRAYLVSGICIWHTNKKRAISMSVISLLSHASQSTLSRNMQQKFFVHAVGRPILGLDHLDA